MEVFGFRRQSADTVVDDDVRACQFCPVQAYDRQSKLFLCDDGTLGFAFECVPLAGGDQHTKERIEQLFFCMLISTSKRNAFKGKA